MSAMSTEASSGNCHYPRTIIIFSGSKCSVMESGFGRKHYSDPVPLPRIAVPETGKAIGFVVTVKIVLCLSFYTLPDGPCQGKPQAECFQ